MPRRMLMPHKSVFSYSQPPKWLNGGQNMNTARCGYRVFSANSSEACMELAKKITERLGTELGKAVVYQESNGETRVEIKESVRGHNIFIIQTISRDVNTAVMELLIMAYALKTSCANNIIGVIPYFPYSKQSKMRKRGSIVCKLLASMMSGAGLTHIITMDLHQKEIQGFFNFPVENLRASPFLLQYIQEEIQNYKNAVIVAKSPDAAKRAQSYAERLRLGLAVIHGEPQCAEHDMVDGRHSPPTVKNTAVHKGLEIPCTYQSPFPGIELPMMMPKEKPPICLVGDVHGKIAIIVDDIIDEVESFVAAAEILKERGAFKVYVMATHGILSSDAPRLIELSAIDEVVVTNTIPHELQKQQCSKIRTVDISLILSEAIRRIHNGESMSYLFRNIALDD
ncbi:phosphoribosyl pyrophosphate synthetase-associated protein 1 S homeolog isoform X1 [Xenopus laevis]|uniref:Phosphoribosyl pyrophosphate synthetase-associated protein 1 S homeolog n=3 Tax=Xenopus laevis TaxID=8355 RepID=Q7ZX14_XENLA|nr:phosphoribosyl pyrophosphate synthetase-associated protein 1 S homeolog [Xenopus laevis]XP_018092740.1 phosphoribosyl pyrophosphate synthetase-associated protein 1 S homeolog isoform X1 [Xenopus laevis]XP_018092741.1 phosphoribosyl pyrophosphate synthetase-associated protein 1 S homeolog isoform X1 [Xenopus laevis]XP_018092742.1 phosphoribosyl pyrophosphate synthetase-associated protein 1 S homeolog isoform X1 [Xenopus laevis]AAH46264.1 Prpsap1-prov protein [Xenopus laevis]OCT60703.1 hypoth